jgi:hypothetical protein
MRYHKRDSSKLQLLSEAVFGEELKPIHFFRHDLNP